MEEEDEQEASMGKVSRKFASILDAQDAKYPAERPYLNDTHFCSLPQAKISFKLNTSFQKRANDQSSVTAIPD